MNGIDPIAIIGFSFKFPQNTDSEDSFWSMLTEARCATTEFPKTRLDLSATYHPDRNRENTIAAKGGHFLQENISTFDAPFFSISASEAAGMDPQQRGLLETTYRALENAGLPLEKITGSKTAVYTGCFTNDWKDLYAKDPEYRLSHAITGTMPSILANRLSWFFNFQGPSANIDTACSSSLVALNLACKELANKDVNMAVIAASNLILAPDMMHLLESLNMISPDSRCFSFDHKANGYARGEGFATIVLKRLSDAIKNNDTIRAVIRGTGVNQDGFTSGITKPNMYSQEALIRETYHKAGLPTQETMYFEAHGTGTEAGDPCESIALGKVFRVGRQAQHPLFVGAVKSNIGHLEGASGLAGLIKTILVLERGIIPPNTNFERINPRIDEEFLKLKFPTTPVPWPQQGLRRASLNSFGFGGTNAHVILDDALHYLEDHNLNGNHNTIRYPAINSMAGIPGDGTPKISPTQNEILISSTKLLIFSTSDESGIQRLASEFREHFTKSYIKFSATYFDNLAYTLNKRRSMLKWKSFMVTDCTENFIGKLLENEISTPIFSADSPRIAFVFTGQGAQWARMGTALFSQYPLFHSEMRKVERILKNLGCTWNLLDELSKTKECSNINLPGYSQPICTAIQVALISLLRSFNISPVAVVGHSSGEIAAAYCIGAISLASAIKIAYYRGLLSSTLEKGHRNGAMLSVGLAPPQAQRFIDQIAENSGHRGLVIACINSPKNVTISGDEDQIDILKSMMITQQIFAAKLQVNMAYHSPHMYPIADQYHTLIGDLKNPKVLPMVPQPVMISSLTGQKVSFEDLQVADYWVKNLTSPVKFSEAVQQLCSSSGKIQRKIDGSHHHNILVTSLLEIGPHSALRGPIRDILTSMNRSLGYDSVLIRNSSACSTILSCIGRLYCAGYPVDLETVNFPRQEAKMTTLHDLPQYPFDHSKEYWDESRITKGYRYQNHPSLDLLGKRVADWNPLNPRWRNFIRESEMPWVKEHKINGSILYPAGGMLVMAIEAVNQVADHEQLITGFKIKDAKFHTALIIPQTSKGVETEFHLRPVENTISKRANWFRFNLYTFDNNQSIEICNGLICPEYRSDQTTPVDGGKEATEELSYHRKIHQEDENSGDNQLLDNTFYSYLKDMEFGFGPAFQPLTHISYNSGQVKATLKLFRWPASQFPQPHITHPTTMDGILHISLAVLSEGGSKSIPTVIPTALKSLWISNTGLSYPNDDSLSAIAHGDISGFKRDSQISVTVMDQTKSHLRAKIEGLQMSMVASSAFGGELLEKQLCHRVSWEPDISILDHNQVARLFSTEKVEPLHFTQDLELSIFNFLADLTEKISMADLPPELHLKKYLTWAQKTICKISSEEFMESMPHLERIECSSPQFSTLIDKIESNSAEGKVYAIIGMNLVKILTGQVDIRELLYSSELLHDWNQELNDTIFSKFGRFLDLLVYRSPGLKFLEIGAGIGGLTSFMMKIIGTSKHTTVPRYSQYDVTDNSSSSVEKAQRLFKDHMDMSFKTFDIDNDPLEQGFVANSYDVIIAANTLHTARNLGVTLSHIRALLKPGGKLVLFEVEPKDLRRAFVMGLLPGWWLGEEESRSCNPCLTSSEWNSALRDQGFSGIDQELRDYENDVCHETSVFISTAYSEDNAKPLSSAGKFNKIRFIKDRESQAQLAITAQLMAIPEISSHSDVGTTSLGEAATLKDLSSTALIFLPELERPFLKDLNSTEFKILAKIMSSSANVFWLSRGGGENAQDAEYSLVDGFARCARAENNALGLVTIAFEMQETKLSSTQLVNFGKVLSRTTVGNSDGINEPSFIEIRGHLNIGRVLEASLLTDKIHIRSLEKQLSIQTIKESPPLKLDLQQPGLLTSLRFIEDQIYSAPFEVDDVEIEVHAVGLNFKDCLIALDQIGNDSTLGFESAGIISRLGEKLENSLEVGDRVCIITPDSFKTYIRAKSSYICKIPDHITLSEAASIPVTFLTCWVSLYEIGRLQPGESILIHSGAGGTGQAAIQIAQYLNAEIFVTVGSEEKKRIIMNEYQIPEDHIFYSRDTSFAKGINRITGNQGVDVVLNSLSEEGLLASWELMKPYGRFVEIGKKDILANSCLPMEQFAKSVSFCAFDLSIWMGDHPRGVSQHLKTIMGLFSKGMLRVPRPLHIQPISQIEDAFRFMQDGDHIGKVVLEMKGECQVPTALDTKPSFQFSKNQTIVIAGGLGGLGQSTAEWMVNRGARNLILLSRTGPRTESAIEFLNKLRARGARIETPPCDISDGTALQSTLEALALDMPPIKGCIQASMVLNDSLIANMTFEEWSRSLKPKVQGSWNLHSLLPRDMDFFILLSSVSGILGTRGQANYAAGNTYMDALAIKRTLAGEKAVSIDLGPMKSDGFLVNNKAIMDKLISSGDFRAVSREQYYALLDYYCDPGLDLLEPSECQITIGLQPNSDEDSSWAGSPFGSILFSQNIEAATDSGNGSADNDTASIKRSFKNASTSSDAVNVVLNAVIQRLSKTLSTLSRIDTSKPLHTYGIDSLLAIEIRNWIFKVFGADVPIFEILGGSTFLSLANGVVEKSGYKKF